VIVGLDGRQIASDDELIREVSARAPGSEARVLFVRDRQEQQVAVRLAEREACVRRSAARARRARERTGVAETPIHRSG
jgi:PDZ domain-containing secreted protein